MGIGRREIELELAAAERSVRDRERAWQQCRAAVEAARHLLDAAAVLRETLRTLLEYMPAEPAAGGTTSDDELVGELVPERDE
jgi:hypothetical protein